MMVSSWDESKICHRSINACLCPLYAIEGMHVVTVEGTLSFLVSLLKMHTLPFLIRCPPVAIIHHVHACLYLAKTKVAATIDF